MSWREAWRISSIGFTELSVQAIYAFRQGNIPPSSDPRMLVPRARRRVRQSKILVSLIMGVLALGALALLRFPLTRHLSVALPFTYYAGGVLSALFIIQIALLWWTGLQVLPTYLGSGIVDLLETLPIEERTLDRATLLLFLRLFDAPALVSLILFPLAVGLALGSVIAGLAALLGMAMAIAFALVLALLTGRFFLHRVQNAESRPGHTVLRWAYLVLWAIPAFAMYGFVAAAPGFFTFLGNLVANGPSFELLLLESTYPFPLGFLPGLAANPGTSGWSGTALAIALGAAAAYGVLFAWTLRWLRSAPRRLARVPVSAPRDRSFSLARLRTGSVSWAVLTKDLRTASRTPGYAFLILLPLLDAVAIGLWTYVSAPAAADVLNLALAAVATAALLATFFGPAFFAIEVMGYSYTRSLPLPERSLMLGKVSLVALIYLVASGLVLGLTLLRVFTPTVFVLFLLAELPGILAAAFLELGILFRRARGSGLPIVNLYAGAWWVAAVSIPGLIVAGAPLLVFDYFRALPFSQALPAMGGLALAELAVCAPLALGLGVGGGR
jgi:Membrane protein of 12 TMs